MAAGLGPEHTRAQDDSQTLTVMDGHITVTIPADWYVVEQPSFNVVGISPSEETANLVGTGDDIPQVEDLLIFINIVRFLDRDIGDMSFNEYMLENYGTPDGELVDSRLNTDNAFLYSVAVDNQTGILYEVKQGNWLVGAAVLMPTDSDAPMETIYDILASIEAHHLPPIQGALVDKVPLEVSEATELPTASNTIRMAQINESEISPTGSPIFILNMDDSTLDEADARHHLTNIDLTTIPFIAPEFNLNPHIMNEHHRIVDIAQDADGNIWLLLQSTTLRGEGVVMAQVSPTGRELNYILATEGNDPIYLRREPVLNIAAGNAKIYLGTTDYVYVFDMDGNLLEDHLFKDKLSADQMVDMAYSETDNALYFAFDIGIIGKYNFADDTYVESDFVIEDDEDLLAITVGDANQVIGMLGEYREPPQQVFIYDFAAEVE